MKYTSYFLLFVVTLPGSSLFGNLAVQGETIYTMAGETISDGVVLIEDGKIREVGRINDVAIPDGWKKLSAKVVTPGFIDAHTTLGLSGMLNQPDDQEQVEKSAAIQSELRAIDAYNGRDELVDWVRDLGITTINTGHGPRALISGQTMILKTVSQNISDGVIKPLAMITGSIGEGGLRRDGKKSPGTKAKTISMLRAEFIKAGEYLKKIENAEEGKEPARDLKLEALGKVLEGEVPLLLTAHRHQDIGAALRLANEFGFRLILDGASEAHLVLEDIKKAGIPIIVHPTMIRAGGEQENMTLEMAAILYRTEIPFALQSGYEAYVPKTRVVLFEAAMAAAYGLPFEAALESITIGAAEILEIDDRVGSITVGKDADLALFDGDPFEYTTHCTGVVIDGVIIKEEPR